MFIRRALATGAALLATAVLAAGPAHATGLTYTVSGGGSSAPGTAPFVASSTSSLTLGPIVCTSAAVPASPASVITTGPSVVDILTLNRLAGSGCTGSTSVTSTGSWTMHGTTTATAGSTDVVAVHLHGVSLVVAGAICRFTVTGAGLVDGTFDEATQRLTISEPAASGTLTVSNVSGCLGQVQNGSSIGMNVVLATSSALYLG